MTCGSFLYSSSVATRTGARPSIMWCSCVVASGYRSPVFAISRPLPNHGASDVRRRNALNGSASFGRGADAARHAAAVAEEHRDRLLRMARARGRSASAPCCRGTSAR